MHLFSSLMSPSIADEGWITVEKKSKPQKKKKHKTDEQKNSASSIPSEHSVVVLRKKIERNTTSSNSQKQKEHSIDPNAEKFITKKWAAGSNKQKPSLNAKKTDEAEIGEVIKKTVSRETSTAIQKFRLLKNLTQKQLAEAIGEKLTVVTEYENGTATINMQIIFKMQNVLEVRLTGKDIGSPFVTKKPKKQSSVPPSTPVGASTKNKGGAAQKNKNQQPKN